MFQEPVTLDQVHLYQTYHNMGLIESFNLKLFIHLLISPTYKSPPNFFNTDG